MAKKNVKKNYKLYFPKCQFKHKMTEGRMQVYGKVFPKILMSFQHFNI